MKSDIYILYNIFSNYKSYETEYDKKVIYENIKQNIMKLHNFDKTNEFFC